MIAATDRRDLGTIDAPLLVFGGPYGNLQATEALLEAAREAGIPPAHMLCTGDIAAYCAQPQAVARRLREAGIAVVRGNCEEALAADQPDCGCGFAEDSLCDALSQRWYAHARDAVDAETKAWMGRLPGRIHLRLGTRRLVAIHGGVDRINRFIFASTAATEKNAELDAAAADGILAGHCGLPFTQIIENRLWHNAGAIGLPANDGTAAVHYSILSPESGAIRITHHRLSYDHESAAHEMRAANLPAGYADGLANGRWPSLDILPEAERRATGQPLALADILWPDTP